MNIICENIQKSFSGKTVLKSVSFSASGCVAVVGENGAGKTTLLKILATILKPDKGLLRFDEIDVVRSPEKARKLLSFCPETPILIEELTPLENIKFFAKTKNVKVNALDILEEYNVPNNLPVKKLSKGLKKRLSIAISTLSNPEILIMDEPADELDEFSRTKLYEILSRFKNQGKTVIFTSHRYDDILLADYLVCLKDGTVVFQEEMSTLFASNMYVITLEAETEKHLSNLPFLSRFDNKINILVDGANLAEILGKMKIISIRKPFAYELLSLKNKK
ncbi:ABC transporter ATP-binding protein [Pseudothermotoga thermarum]|uniref:ABC transporter related protein n=1 Tax=Pseudothermotoga thermarum DSM 5069 TaxID=688269 RepID=F7YYC9_9THEM|nr:ABC transporter ATP-binding protein [Pseudothermotoga thermarum]AEH50950.1 ABC transporter related protein [Pseudothermotoga thermarum DSM 5069]